MLTKLLNRLSPENNNLKNKSVFFILIIVSFLIRLPFFFRDYIDRDESTFIIMGQSWVNGHLPYMELWDLKPPLNFLFFAAIIYPFGKSIFLIRLFGAIIVAITSFYTYKIALEVSTKKVAFWCAIFCIFFQSLFGSMQGVMSEHISIVFFIPGLYLILKHKEWYWVLASGIFMGLTAMVKLNMAYPIALIGLFYVYTYWKSKDFKVGIRNTFLYGFGIIMVIALTVLPYYLNGNITLWWNSVIEAPMMYANSKRNALLSFAPLLLVILLFLYLAQRKKIFDFSNTAIQLLSLVTIAVYLSFVKGGRLNGHYLIQLYPTLLILVGMAVSKIPVVVKKIHKVFIVLLLLIIPIESYVEYFAIIKNKIEKGTFYNGEGIEVTNYLKENNIDFNNILFTEYHIGYWFLNANPPTKAATHPSNICRSELFPYSENPRKTVFEEIQYILEIKQPQIIVKKEGSQLLDKRLIDENIYVNAYLEKKYTPIKTIGKAVLYQRLK
ncbi:glycosyltransferase family 39 protein [Cellulophaga sp. L1A9]|uniref:ArnT family glycosyltransferase n=1 Tax=Cellulophaga sp. L1A9 TaxID=2686362 RepID=UPI00131C0E01|nr:phospholipid carrier-dependent glycosyltransferase [Cellulophaga sp. L1A9]